MSDPIKDAWNDVADSFAELGRTMKSRFERGPEPDEPVTRGSDPTAALREAFEQLIAAGRDLGDKFTTITRDDELKGRARQVGTSINQALEATVDQLTGEMRSFFKGSVSDGATVDTSATDDPVAPSADDTAADEGPAGPDDDTDPAADPA